MKLPNIAPPIAIAFCLLSLSAFGQAPTATPTSTDGNQQSITEDGLQIQFQEPDREQAKRLLPVLLQGRKTVTRFFHRPFPKPFTVRIFPDRSTLDTYWRTAWKMPGFQSEKWMVASGTADMLAVLSPNVWKTQAVEHDPDDKQETEKLVTHEMVHVFHSQNSPNPNMDGMDEIGWFAEGLAVYVSGQLKGNHLAPASEAISLGKEPKRLADAWSGKYRYGVSGSLVAYIAGTYGRKKLDELLKVTTQEELLKSLGLSEQELLARWRASVLDHR